MKEKSEGKGSEEGNNDNSNRGSGVFAVCGVCVGVLERMSLGCLQKEKELMSQGDGEMSK